MKTFNESISPISKNLNSMATTSEDTGMSQPVRPKKLPNSVIQILTDRIVDEYNAYFLYRNAANWCKDANYKKATAFFEKEAEGELSHATGLQNYLVQWNIVPTINAPETVVSFVDLVDVINKAYTIEYELLEKYSDCLNQVLQTHPATFNFLQKYVDIQNGEVEEYSDLLNALELINHNNKFEILYFENNYF